jgi:hypothetical protein
MVKRFLSVSLLALAFLACSNWEQSTFKFLSSAQATIQCASAGYNHDDALITQYCASAPVPSQMYLPQTRQVHDIIQKAQEGKDIAVNAMIAYEAGKAVKNAADQATLQNNVNVAVSALTADIAEIAALVKGGKP